MSGNRPDKYIIMTFLVFGTRSIIRYFVMSVVTSKLCVCTSINMRVSVKYFYRKPVSKRDYPARSCRHDSSHNS